MFDGRDDGWAVVVYAAVAVALLGAVALTVLIGVALLVGGMTV